MTLTTHLALPLIDAAQAQKHVTHNEALAMLDALAHLSVEARNVVTPPASPGEGDRVLVGGGATGAFAGKDQQIAVFLAGAWSFLAPQAGWRVFVAAEKLLLVHDGAAWGDLGAALRELQNLSLLGIGTTADSANPLAAKLNAALFTAKTSAEGGGGDLRVAFNKENAARTVSQIYQSNYSGRAEIGLTGDDDFRVKVSSDGANWKDAIVVDRGAGAVAFPSGGPTKILTFAASGTYVPSPGVTFIDAILFGAGGGGGSGARVAAGVAGSGGGGGGGGGIARGQFTSAQIGASQTVIIGAGGAGGASQTTNSAAGIGGSAGGVTALGSLLRAFGGGGGAGGQIAAASGGGGGGSLIQSGGSATAGAGGTSTGSNGNGGSGGGGGFSSTTGHTGTGGGGAPANGGDGALGGWGVCGSSTGGGGGGGISAANVAALGGYGGAVYPGGTVARAAPGQPGLPHGSTNWRLEMGGSGGGGGDGGLTTALAGGSGGAGGGGGGGGASRNGAPSGAGGAGGAGYAIIIEYF